MKDYTGYSYWLESCGDDLTPRSPLDGSIDVDIAVLGAGYSGLWTAYYLLQRDPSLQIALVEKEIAGFGASGRNGGWCSTGVSLSAGEMIRRYGEDGTRRVMSAMFDTVDEIGRVVDNEGLDIDYEKSGALRLARKRHQLPAIQQAYSRYQELGFGDRYQLLSRQETDERVRVTNVLGSLYTPHCAVIHPGKLVRGLARTVEGLGAHIYEQTAVTGFTGGSEPALHTTRGDVRARKAIVLAGEAYLSQLKQLRRQLIPVYSLISLTEPLSDEQWAEIGWAGRECVSSPQLTVNYLSKTTDGRIVFGGRGAPYHLGSSIADRFDRHHPTHEALRSATREWFPAVEPDQFSHAWGGPLGVQRDWTPTIDYDPATGVATARGYVGQGVAPSNLAGRVLTDLITETPSELTTLPLIGHQSSKWEPEPLRYLGVRYVQRSYFKLDREAEQTGRPARGTSLAERLSRH